ncbi:MAG: hypothetical protein LAT67_07945 [Balneolales bacterium]|nr:hypothetical protein [Balneolales bacterium]
MLSLSKISTSSGLSLFITLLLTAFVFQACSDSSSTAPDVELRDAEFMYGFNEGQLLGDPSTGYNGDGDGDHPRNLMATILIEERADGMANVTVTLENTLEGFTYPVHAHDAADPSTTPNGTPYNESPNSDILAGGIEGNGGTAMLTNETEISYDELVSSYEGFFVVHDPTQPVSTTDLTTYLVLGFFAQSLDTAEPNLRSVTFEYSFNEGQLLGDPSTAYDGEHPRDLSATLTLNEQIDGSTELVVMLNNALDGETYAVHTHDAADPSTTPNGTPYNETPNGDILNVMVGGNGHSHGSTSSHGGAMASQTSSFSLNFLTRDYEGFFVIHDPLQDISTTDLTTYLVLDLTAR